MQRNRMEAFSDGVLAIIITVMVLELKIPKEPDLASLLANWHLFLSYVISFVYVAIYWNNHHHLVHTVQKINGKILWANNHLLFWLSLIPFATAWSGESEFQSVPVIAYGFVLLMCAVAYFILTLSVISSRSDEGILKKAVKGKFKEYVSMFLYLTAVLLGLSFPLASIFLYFVVAVIWLIPDRRIEEQLGAEKHSLPEQK